MSEGQLSVSHDPDDLRDASRERLLAEIGRLNHQYQLHRVPEMQQRLSQIEMELLQNRDYVRGLMAEIGELQDQLAKQHRDLHREVRRKNNQLEQLKKSATWRVGRLIMTPIRILRRMLKLLT
jgi:Mg2+ and Co2+ transporter CorA